MRRQVRRQVPPRSLHLRLRKRDSASRQSEHWHRRPSRSLVSRLRRHSTSNPIRRATSGMATSTPNNNARHLRRSAHHTLLRRRSTSGSRGIIHRSSRIGRSSTNITSHYRRTSFSRQSISRLPPPPPPPLRAKLHAVLPRRSAAPWSSCSSLEAEQQRPRPRRLSSSQHSRRRSSWRRSTSTWHRRSRRSTCPSATRRCSRSTTWRRRTRTASPLRWRSTLLHQGSTRRRTSGGTRGAPRPCTCSCARERIERRWNRVLCLGRRKWSTVTSLAAISVVALFKLHQGVLGVCGGASSRPAEPAR